MREEERKYSAARTPAPAVLAGLLTVLGALPGVRVEQLPPLVLCATYWDTPDLRLARAGVTVRHRTGEDGPPWQVKIPLDRDAREELAFAGGDDAPPPEAAVLVTAWARGADLEPVAELTTHRSTFGLYPSDDAGPVPTLVEVVDDEVAVSSAGADSTFREIEVERKDGERDLLDLVDAALIAHGAVPGELVPKLVRALGPRLPEPPAAAQLTPSSPAADVLTAALRRTVARLQRHDPLVRRRAEDAVHQMRVCCRRLRSDLRTFRSMLDEEWTRGLREELTWLAARLGAVRDSEVLRARLRRTALAEPLAPLPTDPIDRVDADLATRDMAAWDALDAALISERYLTLLDGLVDAAARPRLRPEATGSAEEVLTPLIAKEWTHLRKRAVRLAADDPVDVWHQARIYAKRARYAAEAAAPALGGDAERLGKGIAAVQDVLGEHQDAAVAVEVWHQVTERHPDDPGLVLVCGRLMEREWNAVRGARADFPATWRKAAAAKRVKWLTT
jgi:CHAD domain-containing protein